MDEQRPYEKGEPQFRNLPDVDAAWADMKARLDGADRRRRFVLPPFFAGCGGWALLLLLLAGGGLWWYFSSGDEKEWVVNKQEKRTGLAQKDEKVQKEIKQPAANRSLQKKEEQAAPAPGKTKEKTNIYGVAIKPPAFNNNQQKENTKSKGLSNKKLQGKNTTQDISQKSPKGKRNILPQPEEPVRETVIKKRDSIFTATPVHDTTATKEKATGLLDTTATQKGIDSVAAPALKGERKSKGFVVAAGLSLQQQLPLAGQQWTPYDYRGRRGSLADYVPAADLRLYKGDKWFIQAGFRYGAPQYTREFVYSKAYKRDTFGVVQSSTAYKLKKTYYHQVPVSFNYFVKQRWSIGAGVVYNKFFGAVSEKEDRQQLTPTTDSLIGKALVRDRNDSIFRSSNWQLLFEMQCQWKRFSVGARFTQGLQPFIHYIDAQGQPQKQKNHAVNLFIRYELWRQKHQAR